jgi:hypothetical protein
VQLCLWKIVALKHNLRFRVGLGATVRLWGTSVEFIPDKTPRYICIMAFSPYGRLLHNTSGSAILRLLKVADAPLILLIGRNLG